MRGSYVPGSVNERIMNVIEPKNIKIVESTLLSSQLDILKNLFEIIIDLLIFFPFGLILNIAFGIFYFGKEIWRKKFFLAFKILFAHICDFIFPSSNIALLLLLIIRTSGTDFYFWTLLNFVFLISYVVITSQFFLWNRNQRLSDEVQEEDVKKRTVFDQILYPIIICELGIGRFQEYFLLEYYKAENTKKYEMLKRTLYYQLSHKVSTEKEMKELVLSIFSENEIDPTFFFYAYIDDPLRFEENVLLNNSSLAPTLGHNDMAFEEAMIYSFRDGFSLFWKLYEKAQKSKTQTNFEVLLKVLFFTILIFLKIGVPIILEASKYKVGIPWPELLVNIVFYIYIGLLIYPIFDGDDIKLRSIIIGDIIYLLELRKEVGHIGSNVFDYTCPLSLETWDNIRRCAIQLERRKTQIIEVLFIFLSLYFIFLFLLQLQILFNIYFFISKTTRFKNPLLFVIITIDLFIIIFLVLKRLYIGTQLNWKFIFLKDTVNILDFLYGDLFDLIEVYFFYKGEFENSNYKLSVHKLNSKIDDFFIRKSLLLNDKPLKTFYVKKYLKKIKDSISKVLEQIDYDERYFCHKFFFILPSNFRLNAIQIMVLIMPIMPNLLNYLTKKVFK